MSNLVNDRGNGLHAVDLDEDAFAIHSLTGTDFCGLAGFWLSIDTDVTQGDKMLACSGGADDSDAFEQITQFNVIATQLKMDCRHRSPFVSRGSLHDAAIPDRYFRRVKGGRR
jgi:hypothetical protein